jgi:hypothetical protein
VTFEDPHKWHTNNCCLISDFVLWRVEKPVSLHYQVKVFDECHVNHTHLRNLVVWSKWPLHEWYQRDIVVESWTITVLTLLNDSFPLIYSLTQDASNGDKFISFIIDCLPFIHQNDIILGNNCQFHQLSWSGKTTMGMLASVGAKYRLLPKYCPQFSPTEKVFSFFKAHLCASFNSCDDLLPSIVSILNKITVPIMISWYESCGWLL